MKILMTGATGLVGKVLGEQLATIGHSLVVLARNVEKAHKQIPYPAEIYAWDGISGEPPKEALEGVQVVIHLAGESIASGRWSEKRKQDILNSRALGTKYLVEGIKKTPSVKTLISASAIGIYGDRGDELLSEDSSFGQDFLAQVCQKWETEAQKLSAQIRVVNFRIGVVLSSSGGALDKLIPLFATGLGSPVGDGNQVMSWIHIQDLVNMIEHAVDNDSVTGVYNAVSPNPVSNKVFSKSLAKALGRWMILPPVPAVVLKTVLGEMSTIVLSSQKVSSQKIIESGFKFKHPNIEEALKDVCS